MSKLLRWSSDVLWQFQAWNQSWRTISEHSCRCFCKLLKPKYSAWHFSPISAVEPLLRESNGSKHIVFAHRRLGQNLDTHGNSKTKNIEKLAVVYKLCVVVSVCVSCLMPSAHKCPSGWGPASRSACCCALFSSEWYHRIIDQLTSVLLVHVGPKMSQDVPRDGSSRSQILVSRDLFRAKSAMH